jgi:hypothetical protein
VNTTDNPRANHPGDNPDDTPIDLTALQADDELLDRLAAGYRPPPCAEEVEQVLGDWRHSVEARALPPFNMTDEALRRIRKARQRYRLARRLQWLAVAAFILGALAITAWIATL